MLKQPTRATLAKYGLRTRDWEDWAEAQHKTCWICRKLPKSGRLCIDHEHVKGFKKMPPEQKRQHVRGLLCFQCNRYKVAKNTLETAKLVVQYLEK